VSARGPSEAPERSAAKPRRRMRASGVGPREHGKRRSHGNPTKMQWTDVQERPKVPRALVARRDVSRNAISHAGTLVRLENWLRGRATAGTCSCGAGLRNPSRDSRRLFTPSGYCRSHV
jgi:hypothetical protein